MPRNRAAPARRRRRPRQRLPLAGLPTAVHRADRRLRRGRGGAGPPAPAPAVAAPWPSCSSSAAPTPTTGRRSTTGCSAATTATSSCSSSTGSGTRRRGVGPAHGEAAETMEEMIEAAGRLGARHGFVAASRSSSRTASHQGACTWTPARVGDASRHGTWPGDPRAPDIHRAATPEADRAAVAAGARVHSLLDGRTALHQAAFMGDLELVTGAAGRRSRPGRRRRDARHDGRPGGRVGSPRGRAPAARLRPRDGPPDGIRPAAPGRGLA